MSLELKKIISNYVDFPKKGILFRDIFPILQSPEIFSELIHNMSSELVCKDSQAIVGIDARGFIFGAAMALKISKPFIPARKSGKLPGDLIQNSYQLEYGENILCIQKDSIEKYEKFLIVDDLLATGGTAECVGKMLKEEGKEICGLSVVVELNELNGRKKLDFPVSSQVSY